MQMRSSIFRIDPLFLVATFGSIVVSLVAILQRPEINPDGICYLLSAKVFSEHGLSAAMHACGQAAWPFYSVIISLLSSVFPWVSPLTVAHGFNLVCDFATTLLFLKIFKELSPNRSLHWFALFVMLCYHDFNRVRDLIIRDHGYWAFYLASFYWLFAYLRKPSSWRGLAWFASITVASLFRVEGLIFLCLAPLAALMINDTLRKRLSTCMQLFGPHAVLLVSALMLISFYPEWAKAYSGRVPWFLDKISRGWGTIAAHYVSTKEHIAKAVLTPEGARDAGMITMLVMIGGYCLVTIKQLSIFNFILLLIAVFKRLVQTPKHFALVFFTYLFLNVAITSSFYATYFFLSKRYLIAQSLLLLFLIPFVLPYLQSIFVRFRHAALITVMTLLFLQNIHYIL